jgi:hypothetical protein
MPGQPGRYIEPQNIAPHIAKKNLAIFLIIEYRKESYQEYKI